MTIVLVSNAKPQLSQACTDRKKFPTILKMNSWNKNLRHPFFIEPKKKLVGGLVIHLQKYPPNLGWIDSCASQMINPTNTHISFQFQWKIIVLCTIVYNFIIKFVGKEFPITTCLKQLWKAVYNVPTAKWFLIRRKPSANSRPYFFLLLLLLLLLLTNQ